MGMTTIDLGGETLTDLQVEYSARLHFTGGYFVRIETPFVLEVGGQSAHLTPDTDPPEALKPLDGLVGQAIADSLIDRGTLTLNFDDGARIVVRPDDDHESWTVTGPEGLLIVCMPSGELAVWSGMRHDESN